MEFKDYIREKRISLGYSQEVASEKIGCSPSSIQNWERGASIPDNNSIKNIASAYNLNPGAIFNIIGKQFDKEYLNDNSDDIKEIETNYKEEYIKVLPNDLNLSLVDNLRFTNEEQELFLLLGLTLEFNGNPVPCMYEKIKDYKVIGKFLDKIEKLKLYDSRRTKIENKYRGDYYLEKSDLSEKGIFLFNLIKFSSTNDFDIYKLNFKDFLNVCFKYNIHKDLDIKIQLLRTISKSDCYLYIFEKDNYSDYYHKERVMTNIKDGYSSRSLESALETYLDTDYYTIIEEECSDEEYLLEKELYQKKLEFYEAHKDLNDGLVKPTKYRERINKKVVLTEKGQKFIELYNRV